MLSLPEFDKVAYAIFASVRKGATVGAHERLDVSTECCLFEDAFRVSLVRYRKGLDCGVVRFAYDTITARELFAASHDGAATVRLLRDTLERLVRRVCPPPLPPFRILTRGAQRLRAPGAGRA